ncbi:MAG: hypothetical protein ISS57_12580 [Anaerolineales bacterium]|nr:hypothetical protein [Anaerolineales bacterium]
MNENSKNYTWAFVTLIMLLILLVTAQGWQLYSSYQRQQTSKELAEAALITAKMQRNAIEMLVEGFEAAAYDNPKVDTIYQQQFLATESTLYALEIVVIQNSQIIELLAQMP